MQDMQGLITLITVVFLTFVLWIVSTFFNDIRRKLEPKSGFKITQAYIGSSTGKFYIRVRDYEVGKSYDFDTVSRPTDDSIIKAVKDERAKNQKEVDEQETFKAQFKGRVFQE